MTGENRVSNNFMQGVVTAVARSPKHTFSKPTEERIRLLAGLGVEGDAHMGATVKHRSHVKQNPAQPNLRQVHLIHEELHDELRRTGFAVTAGGMGENIVTRGIDLLGLPTGTRLRIGQEVVLEVTGLRSPCPQLDGYLPGLMQAVLGRDEHGKVIQKSGVMSIVLEGGEVGPGDRIEVVLPPTPHRALEVV